ncbi:hypothetical protein [Haloplanus pelagicus]|nr:hypothetical protein [Haloplanus sp. HW8-1]
MSLAVGVVSVDRDVVPELSLDEHPAMPAVIMDDAVKRNFRRCDDVSA